MHMIDVMKKLQEIAEDGYNNEDIQRGINAAAIHKFDQESAMARGKINESVSDDITLSSQKLAQVAGNKTAELMIKIVTDAKEKFPQLKGKDTLVGGVPQHQHELDSFLDNLRKEVDNAIAEKSIDGFESRSHEYMGNLKELGLDQGVYKLFNRIEAMLEESIAEEFVEAAADEVVDESEVAEEEEAVELDAVEEVHEDVEESRMGYSDAEKLGSAGASKIDNVLRRKIYDMGKDIRDIEPGTLDQMRYQVAKELGLVEEVHEDVEEDTSLADMLKLAGRSGVMGLSENNIIAESLELDEDESRPDGKRFAGPTKSHTGGSYDFPKFDDPDDDDLEDLEEAYIYTSKDAIDTLGELRKIGKSIERGQGEYEGNLANKYANDVYDVISWVENNLDKYEPNYEKVLGPVEELRKKAKGMERKAGSGKDARFGNEIVNTLYPLMQWIEMNAHGSGVKEVEEEAIDEAEVELDEAEVEETVEVPVSALSELMRLAGYEDYESKINEYENDPEEEYMDVEDQMIGLSGGLNGPKGMYPTAAGGDNAMAVSALKVKEDTLSFESFYKKYQEFVTEEK